MKTDADLQTMVLKDTDITICDAEIINFDWLKDLNNGVRPVIFIAVAGRTGQPVKGCMHSVTVSELKTLLTQMEQNKVLAEAKHA